MTSTDENRRPVPGAANGSGDTPWGLSPGTGRVDPNDPAYRIRALAENAIGRVLKEAGVYVPLYLRRRCATAAVEAVTGTDEKQEPVPGDGDSPEGVSPLRGWPNPTLVMALRLARPEQAVDLFLHTPARIHAYLEARNWVCKPGGDHISPWHHPKLSSRFPQPGFDEVWVPDAHPYDLAPGSARLADDYRRKVGAAVSQLAEAYGIGELSVLAGIANTEPAS